LLLSIRLPRAPDCVACVACVASRVVLADGVVVVVLRDGGCTVSGVL
jgi:hypothetical protein